MRQSRLNEQPGFSEHSANIKRLTDTQALVIGARYGDKGLLVVTAPDEAGARGHFSADPMVAKDVFRADVHPFSTFKHGCTTPQNARKSGPESTCRYVLARRVRGRN